MHCAVSPCGTGAGAFSKQEETKADPEDASFPVTHFSPVLVPLACHNHNVALLGRGNGPPDGCVPILYNIFSVPAQQPSHSWPGLLNAISAKKCTGYHYVASPAKLFRGLKHTHALQIKR